MNDTWAPNKEEYETIEKIEKSYEFLAISVATFRTGSPRTKYNATKGTPNILVKILL